MQQLKKVKDKQFNYSDSVCHFYTTFSTSLTNTSFQIENVVSFYFVQHHNETFFTTAAAE